MIPEPLGWKTNSLRIPVITDIFLPLSAGLSFRDNFMSRSSDSSPRKLPRILKVFLSRRLRSSHQNSRSYISTYVALLDLQFKSFEADGLLSQ
jgi:hypothetical protein